MNIFNNDAKLQKELGYLNKEDILKYVTEGEIFSLVFGYVPQEGDVVTSPLRQDNNPDCTFSYSIYGNLNFVDFGSQVKDRGRTIIRLDCFRMVQEYFGLKNFYETMVFVKERLIEGKELEEIEIEKREKVERKKVEIFTNLRPYIIEDKMYWQDRFGITRDNLINDKVFPVSEYKLTNTKKGDLHFRARSITYCFSEFKSGNKKLYIPNEKGNKRFITNCNMEDIGGVGEMSYENESLVITKSYKDCRVLKNQGLNAIWLQSESVLPDLKVLLPLCSRFKKIFIFFDNDETGIRMSQELQGILSSFLEGEVVSLMIPVFLICEGIKDPADYIEKMGREVLLKFLIERNVH